MKFMFAFNLFVAVRVMFYKVQLHMYSGLNTQETKDLVFFTYLTLLVFYIHFLFLRLQDIITSSGRFT